MVAEPVVAEPMVETIEIPAALGGRVPALRATVAGGRLIELYFTLRPASPTAARPASGSGAAAPAATTAGSAAGAAPPLPEVRRQLEEYLAGRRHEFDLPLAPRGTAFERRVWEALLAIPYGETRSYAEIARAIGHPDACRAVGRANGRNPIPIVIPCHRVIGSDGSLTGYGGGLDLKRLLLGLEGAAWAGAAADRAAPQLALPL